MRVLVILLVLCLMYSVSIYVMMVGWGVQPQNWYVIIFGYVLTGTLGLINEAVKASR